MRLKRCARSHRQHAKPSISDTAMTPRSPPRQARAVVSGLLALCIGGAVSAVARAADYVSIAAGEFASVLASDAQVKPSSAATFAMRTTPVTNREFLEFVNRNPDWARGRVSRVFADTQYLSHWQLARDLGDATLAHQPVTRVSWFAAQAFCEAERPGGRLPSWLEWERVAAADATHTDARANPAWRAEILSWYGTASSVILASVGGTANAYGIQNMHGLIWEWVDDFNALLVAADSRSQGDPDKLQFCGAGAISLKDRDNYAVLMRIALLSSLKAVDTTRHLGFRCVIPVSKGPK